MDVRANSAEAGGRTTGQILKDSLESYDLARVQEQCQKKAPSLWKLLETVTGSGDKEKPDVSPQRQHSRDEQSPDGQPPAKRRRTDSGISAVTQSGLLTNPPLTVTMMLLMLASSQVRNKFQKWLGLYLYAQGVRKAPLNSLRTLGVSVEGKVLGNNGGFRTSACIWLSLRRV